MSFNEPLNVAVGVLLGREIWPWAMSLLSWKMLMGYLVWFEGVGGC